MGPFKQSLSHSIYSGRSAYCWPLIVLIALWAGLSGCYQSSGVLSQSMDSSAIASGNFAGEMGADLSATACKTDDSLLVEKILSTAYSQLGKPYRYGGTSPRTGFDCAGYTQWVYGQHGIKLPRTSQEQLQAGQHVTRDELRPGDLLVFRRYRTGRATHVGIYTGDGKYIHSPQTGDRVKISNAFDHSHKFRFLGARRILNSQPTDPVVETFKAALAQSRATERIRATPAVPAEPRVRYYRVKRGDTLTTIARQYNVSVNTLVAANKLSSKHHLKAGKKLKIPSGNYKATASSTVKPDTYIVRKGDTASTIANKSGVSLTNLLAANNLTRRSTLRVGQRLTLPGRGRSATARNRKNPSDKKQSARQTIGHYEVKKGDTASTIANRLGISTKSLLAANNLDKNQTLHIGRKLIIPGNMRTEQTTPPKEVMVAGKAAAQLSGKKSKKTYTVKKGDTITSISRKTGTSSKKLLAVNNLKKKDTLQIGQKLVVPSSRTASADAVSTKSRKTESEIYQVKSGETVWTISQRLGISTQKLLDSNGMKKEDTLRVGQQLKIPR